MLLEKALPSDSKKLTEITFLSKKFWGYSDEQMEIWKADLSITEAYIEKNQVYLAKIENEIIGYYSFYIINSEKAKLDNLFLLPAFIGKGFGKELMMDFFDKMISLRVSTITLDSEPFAKSFYLKMGFEEIGQQESSIPGRFLPIMEIQL